MTEFEKIFLDHSDVTGADDVELNRFIGDLRCPMSNQEALKLKDTWTKHPDVWENLNPDKWRFPQRPLSVKYIEFLRWSNDGISFVNGDRDFGFFTTRDLREMMIVYHFPEYMPDALPFAVNGGGWFYVFDMRRYYPNNEYPVLFTQSGVLDYEDAYPLGDSFMSILSDSRNPETLAMDPKLELRYPLKGRIWLLEAPIGGLKDMFRLKKLLGLSWGATDMKTAMNTVPHLIMENGHPYAVSRKFADDKVLLSALGYSDEGSLDIKFYETDR